MVLVGQFYETPGGGEEELLLPAEPAELAAGRAAAGRAGA